MRIVTSSESWILCSYPKLSLLLYKVILLIVLSQRNGELENDSAIE